MHAMDKLGKALQKVVRSWDWFEILLVVIFFPWSLLYIVLKITQEYGKEG